MFLYSTILSQLPDLVNVFVLNDLNVIIMSLDSQCNEKRAFPASSKRKLICKVCGYAFAKKFNLKRHAKRIHDISIEDEEVSAPEIEKSFKCTFSKCTAKFRHEKHLRSHEREKHRAQNLKFEKKCPLCKEKLQNIVQHFDDIHDIQIDVSEHDFDSFPSFESWKLGVERDTQSFFRKYRNDEMKLGVVTIYYKCHRSGEFVSKGMGRRRMKRIGSKKIDGFCPASMKVMCHEGQCKVVFKGTHVGHGGDLEHLPLTKDEKIVIANKIASNIPFDSILDSVRTSVSDRGQGRIHLLSRKDLHNLGKSFNLSPATGKRGNHNVDVEESSLNDNSLSDNDSGKDILMTDVSETEAYDFRKNDLKNVYLRLIDSIQTSDQLELLENNYKFLLSKLNVVIDVTQDN